MILYHSTTPAATQAIQTRGFMDGAECYGTPNEHSGVVFMDRPEEGGRALLTIDLGSEDVDSLRRFEWQDPDHRSSSGVWLIPAAFVNARAIIVSVDMREPAHR